MLLFGLTKLLGFVRLQLIAQRFGTNVAMDAFTAANQLPELFYVLVAGGALAAALIPVYTLYLYSDDEVRRRESAEIASGVLTAVFCALVLICGVAALFAPQITHLLVPNYSAETQQLTQQLMRIILLNTILFGISGVISSLLHAHQHFLLPALAPIALDIGYFIGLFLLVPRWGIFGLAWGTVVGALLHIGIQLPGVWRYQLPLRWNTNWRWDGVQEVGRLMLPRIAMLGAVQAADLFIVRVASGLPQGTLSAYFYAYALMQLPETLFGTAVALVAFPSMAELFNEDHIAQLKEMAANTLRLIWFLTLPSAVALIFVGQPAIAFVLQRGAFSAENTRLVYQILLFFSVRIIAEATLEVVARLFYARHNTFTPMLCYFGWFIINVIGTYLFVAYLGVAGLALASTVAFSALSTALFWLNRRELGNLHEEMLWDASGRILLGGVVMGVVMWAIGRIAWPSLLIQLAVSLLIGSATYLLVQWAIHREAIYALRQLIKRPSS